MIKNYLSILFGIIPWIAFSQGQDTCEYVDQANQIGGLDCAMGSLANFQGASYQWLNCDNLFQPSPNDTLDHYTGTTSTTVALVVNYLGCIDTSECQYVCSWGLSELDQENKKPFRILGIDGKASEDLPNVLLIYLYDDGTTKKVFRIE